MRALAVQVPPQTCALQPLFNVGVIGRRDDAGSEHIARAAVYLRRLSTAHVLAALLLLPLFVLLPLLLNVPVSWATFTTRRDLTDLTCERASRQRVAAAHGCRFVHKRLCLR